MATEFDPVVQNQPEELLSLSETDVEDFMRLMPQLTSKPPAEAVLTENLLRAISSTEAALFVIRDDAGRIQSTATASYSTIPTGFKPWVDDVVTDSASRGRGYGLSIMEALHEWFGQRGIMTANLTSAPSRGAAGTLYEKMGYVERDTRVYRIQLPLGAAAVQPTTSS